LLQVPAWAIICARPNSNSEDVATTVNRAAVTLQLTRHWKRCLAIVAGVTVQQLLSRFDCTGRDERDTDWGQPAKL